MDLVLDTAKGVTLSQGEVPSESPYMLKVVEKDGTKINVWKDYFTIDYEETPTLKEGWLTLAFSRIDQLPKVVK